MRFVADLTVTVALGLVLSGCSTNLATGKKQLNILSESREIQLGSQAKAGFLKSYGSELPSPFIRGYVADLGRKLAGVSERPQLPWEFFVVDSQVVNAFALPGGKVFVTRGLLVKLDNEAQLAGVIGHEIGHVTAEHIGQRLTHSLIVQGTVIGLGIASSRSDADWLEALGIGADVGGAVYLLKYSRDQESEADGLGIRYMVQLGYNPVGQLQVMEIFQAAAAKKFRGLELLSTHPLPRTRIRRLEKHIREQYPDYDAPGVYRFNFDAYQTVLEELRRLPEAEHKK